MPLIKLHKVQEVVENLSRKLNTKNFVEILHISNAINRIILEDVIATMDIPPCDRAVLDGFAVQSIDVSYASTETPAILKLCSKPCRKLKPNTAMKVSTGDELPINADAVVPLEFTEVRNSTLYVFKSVSSGYGIARKGEDVRKGEVIVRKGTILRPWHIAALASQGISKVRVLGKVKVAIFSTGSELIEPGSTLPKGKIYDTTRYIIASSLKELRFNIIDMGIVPDNEELIRDYFIKALNIADIVISSGGTSIGERDLTVKAASSLRNLDYFVHGINLIPGRPAAFGIFNGKLIACLSGYPVAAFVELQMVLLPALFKALNIEPPTLGIRTMAKTRRKIPIKIGMINVVRGIVYDMCGSLEFEPLRITGSGILSTLLKSNAILIVTEDSMGIEKNEII
ncbi:MAG: molybdopterin molybdenumtransferase MoeA, partial [Thermoprotei archaeon]